MLFRTLESADNADTFDQRLPGGAKKFINFFHIIDSDPRAIQY